jgi:hypothetical protein
MPGIKQVPTQLMPLHVWGSVLPHPVYSPDLAPSDFHLFPKLKEGLRDQNFSFNKDAKDAVCHWFQEKQKGFFTHEIQKHV